MENTNSTASPRMPSLFIPHGGGPCFFMDWTLMGGKADTWNKTKSWLESIPSFLPRKPKAILIITAHWEEKVFTVSAAPKPQMIFDYSGFPPHTYELSFPAPGHPELAHKVTDLLSKAGIASKIDEERGFDHGVFIPLLVAFPDADIPVVSMSVCSNLDPQQHIEAGKALESLRDEDVLIIASGMSYHNMRAFFTPAATSPSIKFDKWLTDSLTHTKRSDRENALSNWQSGDAALNAHPREEHFIPLMVALGAGGEDIGQKVFSDSVMEATISGFRFG
ncbi:DODA-type extradiol aromatic ring-opening family dioxygenase [Hirschia baltica]|uniref:Extradiol ring-cleavage dioxygenase class III protein subunit B n=1 Tax=Hirschia baltica (strain ATCC 49814 / DSM 5838 / IFAM 1418) TaxID=582402 RepID=C6XP51_HIRBI|nr:class III extradiol ring-cleavage dioxygenase [Hirschia baltica]ACT60231.1 Extradiol ring-cleavage dioxygenase class III protein subunit B [Hirschia baltica ATCC 49814]